MSEHNPTIEPEDYRQVVSLKLILLALLGLGIFLNSLIAVFVLDDQRWVIDNPDIRSLGMSGAAWASPKRTVLFSLAVNYALSQHLPLRLVVPSYHLLNLAVHILAALTLFGIVCRTLLRIFPNERGQQAAPWLAFLAALLWMIHPLQTSSVTYLSHRDAPLMGLCFLLTLYCVIRSVDCPLPAVWYALAIAACILGMGADDEVMAAAPLVVWLYDAVFLAGSLRESLRRRWGLYAGLAACWLLMVVPYLTAGPDPRIGGLTRSFAANLLTQPGVILHYLTSSVWPSAIALDYSDWPVAELSNALLSLGILGVLLALTIWICLKWPKVGFLGACVFLPLLPALFWPVGPMVADSRMYLSLAAEAVLLVVGGFALGEWAGRQWPHADIVFALLALPLIVVLGVTTYLRNANFESATRVLQDTVVKRPSNQLARLALADALLREKKIDQAIGEYKTVFAARTEDGAAVLSILGSRFWLRSQVEAVRSEPESAQQDAAAAVRFFSEATQLRPKEAKYQYQLAVAAEDVKKPAEAAAAAKEGLHLDPKWPAEARRRAWQLATAGDPKQRNGIEAIFLARQASVALAEQQPEMLDTLATAYAAVGRFQDAVQWEERAQKLATAVKDTKLSSDIEARLSLYKKGQPYLASVTKP